jgi:hypothetical protein
VVVSSIKIENLLERHKNRSKTFVLLNCTVRYEYIWKETEATANVKGLSAVWEFEILGLALVHLLTEDRKFLTFSKAHIA